MMKRLVGPSFGLFLGLAVLVGCAGPQIGTATHIVQHLPDEVAAPDYPRTERDAAQALYWQSTQNAFANPPKDRPLNILVLSAGGQYTAFAAGILHGWKDLGTRPDFDVITGVSSGALASAILFAGPDYAPTLTKFFTETKTEDLIRNSPVRGLLLEQSVASSEPMMQQIQQVVDAKFIAGMQASHRAGKRCFVATANQNSRRLVVWDLGAIACSGRPDTPQILHKILLATAAFPGVLPAVEIDITIDGQRYVEYHVDGGACTEAFVRFGENHPRPDPNDPSAKWLTGSNLYVIAGGKLYIDPLEERAPGALKRARSAASAMLASMYRLDLWKLYTICHVSGMRFHHCAVPQDFSVPSSSLEFDPIAMKQMYRLGYDLVKCGELWRMTPPGFDDDEEERPRSSLDFRSPRPATRP